MDFKYLKQVFFVGIGGIGMSALARFFYRQGVAVFGYDRTPSQLTVKLESEGMTIHYLEDVEWLIEQCFLPDDTLVIYTPAVPDKHSELTYFREMGFDIKKRAEVLGMISKSWDAVCVAGTHGKTTISTLAAHIYINSKIGCTAFLGGISNNYNTNFLHSGKSPYVILEADEYDRSFLHFTPYMSVITSIDADHLDIYGNESELKKSFNEFAGLTRPGGTLILKKGIGEITPPEDSVRFFYSMQEEADFYASNIRLVDGLYHFDLNSPFGKIEELKLGIPGLLNVENAIAASALALIGGVTENELKAGLASFMGIRRRFEYIIKSDNFIFIDDYAHHPEEIKATVNSVKAIYPEKRIAAVFQPHLYSRTKDFAAEFAKALDMVDQVFLLDIYPARELPIKGVSSELIKKQMKNSSAILCDEESLFNMIMNDKPDVLLTMGAGDVDQLVPDLDEKIREFIKL